MQPSNPSVRYRFGIFEADIRTGELRKAGVRIKMNVQPFQVLRMLLERSGDVLTREEIARELWPDGTFVDFDHGLNSAMNRIREALGDSARNPRFVETLARRGYRFVAPVERVAEGGEVPTATRTPDSQVPEDPPPAEPVSLLKGRYSRFLASPAELPQTSERTARTLFLLLQGMYLSFYVGALANLPEIEDLFSALSHPAAWFLVLLVTAALLIPVRIFLLSAVLFRAPGLSAKFLRMWPFLLPFDVLWSLAPFLLLHHLSVGVALACMAPLVYSPFAQRALMLMGAAPFGPAAYGGA